MRALIGRETSWDTGDPDIDPSALGALAKQAGVNLGALASASGGTAGKVLGTMGEGLRDAGVGAGIGASLGSVIPGIGTLIGGAAGAVGGAIVGVVHHLLGGRRRKLNAKERHVIQRGLHIYKTHHLPGAFQDAVLYVYHPTAYRRLRAQRRLPAEIEAQLLKRRTYAARAEAIDRQDGARLRRELAHLPHEVRTLVGVGAVTGHGQELHVALHRALAERAPLATPAGPALLASPLDESDGSALAEQTAPSGAGDLHPDLPLVDDAEEDVAERANTDAGGMSPDWGGSAPIPLVAEPDVGAPPTTADEVRAQILANQPRFPPTRWEPLQAPVRMYFWDPFDRQWTLVGEGNGTERAKALMMLTIMDCRFPVTYCLLHTSRSNEVIRAVKNVSTVPGDGDHFGEARSIGTGVSRMWTPQFTFYSRTFRPGEAMRFDLGREADGETGAVPRSDTATDPFLDLRTL